MRNLLSPLHEGILFRLTRPEFLKKVNIEEEKIKSYLMADSFAAQLSAIEEKETLLCADILDLCIALMNHSNIEPPKGWLNYISQYILHRSFPEATTTTLHPKYESSVRIYLAVLSAVRQSKAAAGFNKFMDFEFLTEEEIEDLPKKEEYLLFMETFRECYIYELMLINQELYNQNTLNHVAAVHYVAMHVARQLKRSGSNIDLGLVSGAAAGHDIGKYGCKEHEQHRVPYLHYYYTDQWFTKFNIPSIGLIASNHSTWDLELENLQLESLVLIYADFRVKNRWTAEGPEMHIFDLSDSFDVILQKLDNVDEAKEKRYRKVYAKLKDFENYMIHEGVNVDLTADVLRPAKIVDYALLDGMDVIENFKYMAIEHNTSLLKRLNDEAVFSSMIESARSEQNWERLRAYLNVLDEYSIYLSQREKVFTMYFLYDMLIHREADIRRQAARLLGNVIVNYDMEFAKEKPADYTMEFKEEVSGITFWSRYLSLYMDSGHKVTDKHKEWLGYSMRIFVESVMTADRNRDKRQYLRIFVEKIQQIALVPMARFSVLNSLVSVPTELYTPEDLNFVVGYAMESLQTFSDEITIMALKLLQVLSAEESLPQEAKERLKSYVAAIDACDGICTQYLKGKISENLSAESEITARYHEILESRIENTSDIFLNNLKAATPWNIKTTSINYMMEYVQNRSELSLLQTANHLTNLLKVSEKESVRNKAGNALVRIGPLLSVEQRNEIVMDLFKALEMDELQYSKYIPAYLGRFITLLPPRELDEVLQDLKNIYKGTNMRASALVIETYGVIVQHYPAYADRFEEEEAVRIARHKKILGMILSGLANYNSHVKQETFLVVGQHIYGSKVLSLEDKHNIFVLSYKKLLTLINEEELNDIFFFNNSASFNHIYRFISNYEALHGSFQIERNKKIAFFPGTYDPFSLGHKGIATAIRDLGYEVYLSVDEFSWSKRVQPRMIRRQIINMSIADELNIFLFPDDIPVNLSSAKDLSALRALFADKNVYIVIGSDVLENATAYTARQTKDSIHTFDHIIFSRAVGESLTAPSARLEENKSHIKGEIVELKLPTYLEDISSTQIRDNVDGNRDISTLVDSLAQSFIYDRNLYTREPLEKKVLKSKPFSSQVLEEVSEDLADEINGFIAAHGNVQQRIDPLLHTKGIKVLTLRDKRNAGKIVGLSIFHSLSTSNVYGELQSQYIANYVRDNTAGKIVVIDGIFVITDKLDNLMEQNTLSDTLAYCLQKEYTYALYHNTISEQSSEKLLEILELQGFIKIHDQSQNKTVYGVDMKSVISLTLNVLSNIKEPINNRVNVIEAVVEARKKLQQAMAALYPGNLVLSLDNDMINQKMTEKICRINGVPNEVQTPRVLGENMCVPFGDLLKGMVVPNTVTKSLHTEKFYSTDASTFYIAEYPFYSPIESQVKTIKSFERPVILVDDLMHKGYRIKELDPILKRYQINVNKIIVGILSGRGRDLMQIQEREFDYAYFIPNLRLWFNEHLMYPFVGGDGMGQASSSTRNLIPSINLILPFYSPMFIMGVTKEAIYNLSMVSLQNTKSILLALEEEYQEMYGRKLTTKRLGEVFISPRLPYMGENIQYDLNKEASVYVDVYIENLKKIERIIK